MIAIGITDADSAESARLPHQRSDDLAVLYVDGAQITRDRMTASLRCAEQVRSFLPLSLRNAVQLHAAVEWVKSHHSLAIAELNRLSGMAQLTMTIAMQPGRSLRARSSTRREAIALAEQVAKLLSPYETRESYRSGTLTLHAMLRRSGAAQWKSQLATLASDRHLDAICVGPWPPFSFFNGPS